MLLEHRITVPARADRVWAFMMDIPSVSRCVPGVGDVTRIDDQTYAGIMSVRVGPIAVKLDGRVIRSCRSSPTPSRRPSPQAPAAHGVRIGYHLTPFWSPTDRQPAAIFDEAIDVVRATVGLGFEWVSVGQHWLSHPTVWPAPVPIIARLAPETGAMRLKTSVLLLPLLNPVEVAENVATLDHLTHGR